MLGPACSAASVRIHGIESGLHLIRGYGSGDYRGKIAATITHHDHLLRTGQEAGDFVFDSLRGKSLWPGAEDNQIFDPAWTMRQLPEASCSPWSPLWNHLSRNTSAVCCGRFQ